MLGCRLRKSKTVQFGLEGKNGGHVEEIFSVPNLYWGLLAALVTFSVAYWLKIIRD
jgi:hypothetical protein